MAEAIVGPLLSKLQEVAVKEAKALAEVGGEIDKLRDKLMWLQALVHEADLRGRHDDSRFVQVLAIQIRDAGFQAEDAVDQFYLQGSLTRRFGRHNKLRIAKEFIFHLRTHLRVRATLSRTIRSVNLRLEEIIANNNKYTLIQSGSVDSKTWRASRTIPAMREDWDWDYSKKFELKFRTEAVRNLIEEIMNKKNVSEVITVVGVVGVGKTALLTHVYKEKSIKEEFPVRIWMSFPPDIGDESMLQQIKQELGNKALGKDRKEVCRCFVVIDSPVNTMTTRRKVEKQILEKEVGKGSKIVLSVTSSWDEENINQGITIKLRPLSGHDSRTLFVYGIGDRRGAHFYSDEKCYNFRNSILEITNGLPVAVVLLAQLMRTVDFGKWEAAAAYLKCNSEDNKLKTILSVCVDDLSDELKSCLLYTAGFPENRPIDAHQLVRLWMAEGFLTRQHKMETEELGQCYLKELIYRGLLQLIKKTSSANGGYVRWVAIPEQIHPLLRSEAQRTSFMDVHYGGALLPPDNTRRLALHNYNHKFPVLDHFFDKLRTVVSYSDEYTDYPYTEGNQNAREHGITILGGHRQEKSSNNEPELQIGSNQDKSSRKDNNEPQLVMREFLKGSPYLRVINLEGIQVAKEKKKGQGRVCFSSSQSCLFQAVLPTSIRGGNCLGGREPKTTNIVCALPQEIGEMVNLQYLRVRCRGLNEVPSSIGNLGNLQTIDVRGTDVKKLPESLWKVKTLRHVLGNGLAFPRSTGADLKLMHTLESVTFIDQLTDDRSSTAASNNRGKEVQQRLRLRFLHRLHVANLRTSQGKDLKSVLEDLSSLKALILSGVDIPMDLFVEASPPCLKHVEFLKLDGQLPLQQDPLHLDSCLVDLTHLVLVLRSTEIGQDFIGCIGKLPVLAALELHGGSYKHDKHEMTFRADEFECLTLLRISGLEGLKKIFVPGATTRRNKKEIDTDVPDHVDVVPVEAARQSSGTAAGSDQQGEGGEVDQRTPLTKMNPEAVRTTAPDGTVIRPAQDPEHDVQDSEAEDAQDSEAEGVHGRGD